MKVRITTPGWEGYTGSMGFQATFTNGVSDHDLNPRQIARIGSNVRIIDVETGEQIGPAQMALLLQDKPLEVASKLETFDVVKADIERERAAVAAAEKVRVAAEKEALAEAERKAAEKAEGDEIVIYTRAELEAIAGNSGIQGLREIADPLKVKSRDIKGLVEEILKAQAKQVIV